MEVLRGQLSHIRFYQDGFFIGCIDNDVSVLGNMMAEPILGQEYHFNGQWQEDPQWGRQFKFQSCRVELPQDAAGIIRYLYKTCKWVGLKTARAIVDEFGDNALVMLKTDPDQVAEKIKGITLERAQEISQALLKQENLEKVAIELETMLGGHHIPRAAIDTLIRVYGVEAPAAIRANPSLLMELHGVGFVTADRVALAVGYDRDGDKRRAAATYYVLKDAVNSQGHTWLPLEEYEQRLVKLIGVPSDGIARNLPDVVFDNGMVALRDLAEAEQCVAGKIRLLIEKASQNEVVIDTDGLAPDQAAAVNNVVANGVFILTGAPGTGKTFALRRIVDGFAVTGWRIALAAPTGKAAKRMTEMIGQEAVTIHRLLEPQPQTGANGETIFSFARGGASPLPVDLVIVDEVSMVDIYLAASLLRAVAPGTRLLLVGDHYQLPSVGPGSVLRDLIAAGVPHYELTEVKRNTGDIVKACHAIKNGRPVIPSPTLDLSSGLNFRHIEESNPEAIKEIIKELVCDRLSRRRGYDPLWDIQVMSPMNERTPLSCLHLNEMLQQAINPGPVPKWLTFRPGDKVLQRKNEIISNEFVVNGDLGQIVEMNDKTDMITVAFMAPERVVKIKRKEHNLTLAYCITIHKMQGSESPVVILPVHSSFGSFFVRELIYTAISRAREICITVGQWGALEAATRRIGNDKRITRLPEFLRTKA